MIQLNRLATPLVLLVVAGLVIGLPAERSRDLDGTLNFLALFATTVAIYAIFALALNVQLGYTGVFNFGVAAFFRVGAFTAAIFGKAAADQEGAVWDRGRGASG